MKKKINKIIKGIIFFIKTPELGVIAMLDTAICIKLLVGSSPTMTLFFPIKIVFSH